MTPAVIDIFGVQTSPLILNLRPLFLECGLAGARKNASRKISTLGMNIRMNVLNLCLRIRAIHSGSVVNAMRRDHSNVVV